MEERIGSDSGSDFDDGDFKESFGDYLRQHREAAGKSIDVIARNTRISKRYLQAFEENDTNLLPEETFARGFLRTYAQEIGLDPEECLIRYDRFRRSLMPTQIKDTRKDQRYMLLGPEAQTEKRMMAIIWGSTVFIVLCLAVGGYWWFGTSESSSTDESAQVEEEVNTPAAAETATEVNTLPAGETQAGQTAPSQSPAPAMAVPVKPSVLTITASKEGKLSLRIDDNPLHEVTFRSGDNKTFNVYKEVEIRSADRSLFTFQYNSKPLEVSGPTIKLFNRNLLGAGSRRP